MNIFHIHMKAKSHSWSNNPLKNKFIFIPTALLITLMAIAGPKYAPQIKDAIQHSPVFGQRDQKLLTFPKEGTVETVVDGDTVYLHDGTHVRYLGINSREKGQPFYQEAKDYNEKMVAGKQVKLEYDEYRFDRYDRVLAYVFVDGKSMSLEMVSKGLSVFNNYEGRKPLIYQDQLLKAQEEAKSKKLGMWK